MELDDIVWSVLVICKSLQFTNGVEATIGKTKSHANFKSITKSIFIISMIHSGWVLSTLPFFADFEGKIALPILPTWTILFN